MTLPFECNKNVERILLSPDGVLLLMIDTDGKALLVNFQRKALLHRFNFKAKVYDIKFSPDGRYFAVTHKRQVHVWQTPSVSKEFTPFVLYRKYTGHYDDVVSVDWSSDSQWFVTGAKDTTCRIYSLNPVEGYKPVQLTAHRDKIVGVFFEQDSMDVSVPNRCWLDRTLDM
jgi:periodic tryptophan protein 2